MGPRHEHDWSQSRHIEGSADGPSAIHPSALRALRSIGFRLAAQGISRIFAMRFAESIAAALNVTSR